MRLTLELVAGPSFSSCREQGSRVQELPRSQPFSEALGQG